MSCRSPLTVIAAAIAGLALVPAAASGLTFTVNTTADGDDGNCNVANCTLREAINAANTGGGTDTVAFSIAGSGPHTIQPTTPLPANTGTDTAIDGRTEPDYAFTPVVELDGSLAGVGASGLVFNSGGGQVRGLAINRFAADGIKSNANFGAFQHNYIGTDVTGTVDLGNGGDGIEVADSSNNLVGGLAGQGNVISGNGGAGVRFDDTTPSNTMDNEVMGNLIGTDASGEDPLGNGGAGVDSGLSTGEVFIGDPGGPPGGENVIAYNGAQGILATGAFTQIRGNSIFSNTGLGIDLAGDGVTANDPDDADTGPNTLLNTLVVDTVVDDGSQIHATATVDLDPATSGIVQAFVYASDSCDPSGSGEGERFLGSVQGTALPENGEYEFSASVPSFLVDPNDAYTAVVEDDGVGSSEFSECVTAADAPQANQDVVAGEVSGTVRYRLPGSDDFVELQDQETLPEGTTFDTTEGEVRIVSEAPNATPPDDSSGLREASFSEGLFKLLQDDNAPFTTEARLAGGSKCSSSKSKRAGGRKRRLRSRGRGRHRSRGRRGAGTVRGTDWLTKDTCKGTLFRVFEGQVQVKDFGRKRKVNLDAGEKYLARNR
jgi:CSLREA domain-containing protein